MSRIEKLDDIEIYKEALRLALLVYSQLRNPIFSKEFSLVDQLKRSALSVAANIAEGYGRNTKRDFAQFLSISLGSLNETMTYLDFISLSYSLDTRELKEAYVQLSRRIFSFRRYLLSKS